MRILFNIISILIIIAVIFLASLNTQAMFDMTIWNAKGTEAMTYHVSVVQILLMAFVAGLLVGVFWAAAFYVQTQKKLKEYQRKLEKTSVQYTEDNCKVSVLEAKIEVLEKALQSALDKNNE